MNIKILFISLLALALFSSCQPKQPKEIVADEPTTSITKQAPPEIDWSTLDFWEYVYILWLTY